MHLTANLANQTKMLHQRNPNPTKLKTKFTLELIAKYRTTKRKETHKFPNLRNFPLLEPDQNKSPHPTEPKTEIRKRITSRFQNFIFDSFLPPELSRQPNQTDGKRITKKKKNPERMYLSSAAKGYGDLRLRHFSSDPTRSGGKRENLVLYVWKEWKLGEKITGLPPWKSSWNPSYGNDAGAEQRRLPCGLRVTPLFSLARATRHALRALSLSGLSTPSKCLRGAHVWIWHHITPPS